jgi:hypothetical protein
MSHKKKSKKKSRKLAPDARRAKARPRGKPFTPGNKAGVATRFPEGVSGNPEGRPKYSVASQAARALLASEIPNDQLGRTFAQGICDQLGWMALRGDRAAADTLFDRAEGRPRQSIDLDDGRVDPLGDLINEFRLARTGGTT